MSDGGVESILTELAAAWNAGDGHRLAAVFAHDATMVDVRGQLMRGREAIGREHQLLFDTIFHGSRFEIELLEARAINDELIVAHTRSVAHIPTGPRAGRNEGIQTQLICDGMILAFQNTLCAG